MCQVIGNTALKSARNNRARLRVYDQRDPTRTTVLRQKYAADMRKRFRSLRGIIRDAIINKDVFGIAGGHEGLQGNSFIQANVQRKQFDFPRVSQKIDGFMEWLEQQVENEILTVGARAQIGSAIETSWQDIYIEDSYKRGVQRSTYEMDRLDFDIPNIEEQGGITAVMSQPAHIDRLGVLYTRAFNELKGITGAMDQQISRILAQGLADGDGPALLARKLNSVISGSGAGELGITDSLGRFIPAERRAMILARTETIRAHHQGMMQTYRNWGAEGVTVQAEFRTAGDNRVCQQCAGLEGTVFTLKEADGLIPVHPQCRCIVLPFRPGQDVSSTGQTVEVEEQVDDPVVNELRSQYREDYKKYKSEAAEFLGGQDINLLKKLGRRDPNAFMGTQEVAKAIEEYGDDNFPHITGALLKWQTSPGSALPTRLRQLAFQAEQNAGNVLGWNSADDIQSMLLTQEARAIPMEEYLRARAFNQAFLEAIDLDGYKMYRGIGGPEGNRLREAFTAPGMRRTKVSFDETTLSGWSVDQEVAEEFAGQFGFWIEDRVSRERIFLHHGVLNSLSGGIDGGWAGELENIVLGGRRTFTLDSIKWFD